MRGIVTSSTLTDRIADLAAQLPQAQGPLTLVCKDPAVNARIFAELSRASVPDAIAVEVPRALDQVERVLLSIGAGFGPEASRRLSEALETSGASLAHALGVLDRALDTRGGTLVIRGWDELGDVGGSDPEIRRALRGRTQELRAWLAAKRGIFLSGSSGVVPVGRPLPPVDMGQAPSHLSWHGPSDAVELWSRSGRDSAVYDLRLAQRALAEDRPSQDLQDDDLLDADARGALLDRLDPQISRLLNTLALHGRPLRRGLLKADPFGADDRMLDLGTALGLWFPVGDQLLVHPAWQAWCLDDLHERERRTLHRALAQAFASHVQPNDPHAGRWGLYILEAHRHFVAANDLTQALRYARFGTALLIERARLVSLNAEESRAFEQSAELYGRALDLQRHQPNADPVSLQAYTKHYWHFNRAKAGLEPIQQTIEGYRESVELWPAQALFWSRYIRALFLDQRRAEAMQALADATSRVPSHPNKDATLIGRTVSRLLERLDKRTDLLLDAVEVWDGYRPNDPSDRIARELASRLQLGWRTTGLTLTNGPHISFHREVLVRVLAITDGVWQAELDEAQFRGRGASPLAALQAMITGMRTRCAELLKAYTHTLDARARLEKQNLLGCIDVVRSGLDAIGPGAITFLGTLRREPNQDLTLHTHGSRHLVFELPAALAVDRVAGDQLWIARVQVGASGVPTGPILELKPAYEDEDAVIGRWNRRFANGD